jgi:hypothetical protein
MVDDFPDEARFHQVIGDVIERAIETSESRHASAYGEMVALLLAPAKEMRWSAWSAFGTSWQTSSRSRCAAAIR